MNNINIDIDDDDDDDDDDNDGINDSDSEEMSKDEAMDILKKNYGNINHPVAFSGISKIYDLFQGILSYEDISKFLSTVDTYSIYRETKKNKRNPFYLNNRRQRIEIDLIEMHGVFSTINENSETEIENQEKSVIKKIKGVTQSGRLISDYNDNVKYILTCIDCWSKFSWVEPLVTKKTNEVLQAFKSVMGRMGKLPIKVLCSDRGKEFMNKSFQKYLKDQGIEFRNPQNLEHAPHIERFNKTFKHLLHKYMDFHVTDRYIDKLQTICKLYNKKEHRTLKITPFEAENPINFWRVNQEREKFYLKKKFSKHSKRVSFNIGDNVRVSISPSSFHRSFNPQFQQEIFKIQNINIKNPVPTYTLSEYDGSNILDGTFYAWELSPINIDEFRIEKILKRRPAKITPKTKKVEYYIKWKGFPSKYNTWEPAKNVQNLNIDHIRYQSFDNNGNAID